MKTCYTLEFKPGAMYISQLVLVEGWNLKNIPSGYKDECNLCSLFVGRSYKWVSPFIHMTRRQEQNKTKHVDAVGKPAELENNIILKPQRESEPLI